MQGLRAWVRERRRLDHPLWRDLGVPLALLAILALLGGVGLLLKGGVMEETPKLPAAIPSLLPAASPAPAPSGTPDPAAVVAAALHVKKAQVAPAQGAWPSLEERSLLPFPVVVTEAPPGKTPRRRTISVRFEPDGGSLNYVLWGYESPRLGRRCSRVEAAAFAREWYERTLGPWPQGMVLMDPGLDSPTEPIYHLTWARFAQPGVETGAWVVASVEAQEGRLFSLCRRLPLERHSFHEVRVTRAEAEGTARAQFRSRSRPADTTEHVWSRLMLNYGQPPNDGPAWVVRSDLRSRDTQWRVHSDQLAVDAVTGEVLQAGRRAVPSLPPGAGDPVMRVVPGG